MKNVKTRSILDSKTENYEVLCEPEYQLVWGCAKYPGRPCMSKELLKDIEASNRRIESFVRQGVRSGDENRLLFLVQCSSQPGVFNLGGDLELFTDLIQKSDYEGLLKYAKSCIDVIYHLATVNGLPFTTISLVQGEALGGGFEAALACKVLIAEKSAVFGFPETLFGLFPGMGAFSFLARRINPSFAKRIIASGKIYTAEELYDIGIIDHLVADGEGRQAIYDYIKHHRVRSESIHSLDRVIDEFNPISYDELMNVVNIWADTAMKLSEKNLRVMKYLLKAQNNRWCVKASQSSQVVKQVPDRKINNVKDSLIDIA